jgi:hypothetical protein
MQAAAFIAPLSMLSNHSLARCSVSWLIQIFGSQKFNQVSCNLAMLWFDLTPISFEGLVETGMENQYF